MFLFKKGLIRTYCNRLYGLKEKLGPFSCYGRIKQTAQAKTLMSPILIQKWAHQIVEHAYHHTAHFFMDQNDHHWATPSILSILTMFYLPPPLTLLKITNGSLCHRSFFFEYIQSSLINHHDHHYMYRSYCLYLVKHFVVALTNFCMVKLTQLHQLISFKWARVIVWPTGVKSHHT